MDAHLWLVGIVCQIVIVSAANNAKLPVVVVTWSYPEATSKAWEVVSGNSYTAVDAVEQGCNVCEDDPVLCHLSVGYGGIVDTSGEPTLDAMIMDGSTHDVGAVGGIKNIKRAISVARLVKDHTRHTLLVGDSATSFATAFGGLDNESLENNVTRTRYEDWLDDKCQPNFWENVTPDPSQQCGPYSPGSSKSAERSAKLDKDNHDTIGMVVISSDGNVAVGTSTNGLSFKIAGRVGDSPIVGAGSYADNDIGGAAATGNGDIMMRFLPSYQAVENMRHGMTPTEACAEALSRIAYRYEDFDGALIAVSKDGDYGAACYGYEDVDVTIRTPSMVTYSVINIKCTVQAKQASSAAYVTTLPKMMAIFVTLIHYWPISWFS
ncbi:N(4)-(Beta-N-acetylglucosaminyl)-L-asparaginase-like [Saccoglossus kowalevskii]|uniref:N(4)-(Beta-N-acetylglucosaminyl)-L-asparaginase- like n=1 Tax=Saccoglossus kowalevskii TaxID=10224 RepID=A0ABM0MJT2_SACKO|nr:PREDICTED: N(4)-(Beta-N-acetylglucosaminyl)-L-asparaginase-like [Saccoglossus kowalevskii]